MTYSTKITIRCSECGASFEKEKKEINRQLKKGRLDFFCSLTCGAKAHNRNHGNIKPIVTKTCSACGQSFQTSTNRYERDFCSRACASRGSVSPERRAAMKAAGLLHAGNLIPVHEALRIREDRKYAEVRASLVKMGTSHTFEHPIEHADGLYIFDLFLPDHQALIEFDGPYHNDPAQQERDAEKTRVAEAFGLIVVRIQTSDDVIPATVIPKIMMEIQAVRMRQLVEVSNALHAATKDKPSYILIGPYAEKPPILRQLIEENADRMRQQFAEQGLDFDAWRAGQPFKRSDSRP